MSDRPQTGCSSQHQIQVNPCISQNNFPTPWYVNISFIKSQRVKAPVRVTQVRSAWWSVQRHVIKTFRTGSPGPQWPIAKHEPFKLKGARSAIQGTVRLSPSKVANCSQHRNLPTQPLWRACRRGKGGLGAGDSVNMGASGWIKYWKVAQPVPGRPALCVLRWGPASGPHLPCPLHLLQWKLTRQQ